MMLRQTALSGKRGGGARVEDVFVVLAAAADVGLIAGFHGMLVGVCVAVVTMEGIGGIADARRR